MAKSKPNPPKAAPVPRKPRPTKSRRAEPLLLEISWEVCNQLGGIYTVLRSKVPSMVTRWSNRYCLIGPYNHDKAQVEFEPAPLVGPIGQTVKQLREMGIGAHFGRWLVTGRPNVVLLEHQSLQNNLSDTKYRLFNDHGISTPTSDGLINDVISFGEATRIFLNTLAEKESHRRDLVAHCHEWMAGPAIPMLRKDNWPGAMVFTTHATILGRYLAMNDNQFYDHLPFFDDVKEAKHYNIEAQHQLERAAAHGSHVFTTVSDVTAEECTHLLGRTPDVLLPNGLNINRFAALHEFQNLHQEYKKRIHQFTMAHFFPSYTFDLDNTLYFYTSGRYEYLNKGMDLTIEALARLNHRLKEAGTPINIVFFLITKAPIHSINVHTLQSRAMLEEFRTTADHIKEQVGQRLFEAAATGTIPDLNTLTDEYYRLRLRRAIHAWKNEALPAIVTHDLIDDQKDPVLNQLRNCNLLNYQHDPVKFIYHPNFITATNPLFGIDYDHFVRGTHLGVFPSYYEPWGYTPLESMALGVPAITSDLSGFGSYLAQLLPDHDEKGIGVVHRRYANYNSAADQLADMMFKYCQLSRRERINMRNTVESFSEHFDWHNLGRRYHEAHELALDRFHA
ncbi:glycosyltransferase [Poriferisphaera sp. WC338]|uniref:glycosyltransferase n=1 Tax=Poriferisphaera sp. WC338 TaxID=3425129 RepID=UPI003D81BE30